MGGDFGQVRFYEIGLLGAESGVRRQHSCRGSKTRKQSESEDMHEGGHDVGKREGGRGISIDQAGVGTLDEGGLGREEPGMERGCRRRDESEDEGRK